jgi:hypothetical protein
LKKHYVWVIQFDAVKRVMDGYGFIEQGREAFLAPMLST